MVPLYKLQTSEHDRANFYARDPAHIMEAVDLARKRFLTKEELALAPEELVNHRPYTSSWALKVPGLEDIIQVSHGDFFFQMGMAAKVKDGEEFFMKIPVCEDFTLHINPESLPYLDRLRPHIPDTKRGNLYGLHLSEGPFSSQNFLPEDVALAIMHFDINPWYEFGKEKLDSIAALQHPNLCVGIQKNQKVRSTDDSLPS